MAADDYVESFSIDTSAVYERSKKLMDELVDLAQDIAYERAREIAPVLTGEYKSKITKETRKSGRKVVKAKAKHSRIVEARTHTMQKAAIRASREVSRRAKSYDSGD